jgi:hypothetical protein
MARFISKIRRLLAHILVRRTIRSWEKSPFPWTQDLISTDEPAVVQLRKLLSGLDALGYQFGLDPFVGTGLNRCTSVPKLVLLSLLSRIDQKVFPSFATRAPLECLFQPWQPPSHDQLRPRLAPRIKDSRISIVSPSYNLERFAEATVLSVLNQDEPNIDYIVVDGASADGSVAVYQKFLPYLRLA